jgi:hypothetical protein
LWLLVGCGTEASTSSVISINKLSLSFWSSAFSLGGVIWSFVPSWEILSLSPSLESWLEFVFSGCPPSFEASSELSWLDDVTVSCFVRSFLVAVGRLSVMLCFARIALALADISR